MNYYNGLKANVCGNDWPYNLLEQVSTVEGEDPLDHLSTEGELFLAMCMCRLTESEKRVIKLRYFEQKTSKEVGQIIGVTQERVRQIEAKGVRKLRWGDCNYILRHGAKAYMDKRVNEKVDEIIKTRMKELEDEYRAKMAGVIITDDESKRDMIGKLMATTFAELDLSVRSTNCLNRSLVHTVGELIERYPTYEKLYEIRNLGRKSSEEIIDKVQSLGFNWPVYGENEDR